MSSQQHREARSPQLRVGVSSCLLVVPLTLLKHHLARHDVPEWMDKQVYLTPYPRELMLRNHV